MNKLVIAVAIVLLAGGGYFLLSRSASPPTRVPNQAGSTKETPLTFTNLKKSAHYESNTPEHGATLAGVPINVVIDFNFDLASPSEIKIEKDGQGYGEEGTIIDKNKLSMRRKMDASAPNGVYTVNYKACWPDGSCHEGSFQFAVDRNLASDFEDLTGQADVSITMSNIAFAPKNIRVRRGTKVTWVNDDDVAHYVNTDSHPAHTYYLGSNSQALAKGDNYSLTFNTPGIYPYHCSAHAESMTGSILVE